jgi:hypothetical protein
MTARRAAVIVSAPGAAAIAAVLVATGGSDTPRVAEPVARTEPVTATSSAQHPTGVVVDCSRRSEARFPGAFTDPVNLVVGPLALVGASYTSAGTVREFGGNKFPLLVKAGHTVTVRLAREVQEFAGLAYAGLGNRPLPHGEVHLRDTADTMTFVACQAGTPSGGYRPEGASESFADGQQVTFWSGFVLTRVPRCLPLEVLVDDETSPRRVGLALGRRCRK